MADLVSPGIQIKELDLTTTVVGASNSAGAIGIVSEKGPHDEIVTVTTEDELVSVFGKPNASSFEWFFTAAAFLKYSGVLRVVRIETGVLNAVGGAAGLLIKNTDHWTDSYSAGQATTAGSWAARSAGTWGNSISVEMCPSATVYSQNLGTDNLVDDAAAAAGDLEITVDDVDKAGFAIVVGDIISFTTTAAGTTPVVGHEGVEYLVSAVNITTQLVTFKQHNVFSTKGLAAAVADDSYITRKWRWYEEFSGAPGTSTSVANVSGVNDEMHVIVLDEDGGITGLANTILEKWDSVSKASDAKTDSGDVNYYVDVIYRGSNYIFWMDHLAAGANWGTSAAGKTFTAVDVANKESFAHGTDDYTPTSGESSAAYDKFVDKSVAISFIIGGKCDATHATSLIDIVELKKDALTFISPEREDVVGVANSSTQLNNVTQFFNGLASSSYAVFDSGYKKVYDRYNDQYRWIPLNGDVAGCCAATDADQDPWWSPGGLTRGQIRGSVSLAFNPSQAQRDELYRQRVNPVVTFPGEGTVLWGDKTALSQNSAFNRINVRRLFNHIEDAIEAAARSAVFEFNDEFTRAQFVGIVEPFLRDVQGRRGITDFQVVCDASNNPGQVIDANEFRADVYVKPARSINFITLTFVATRTGVSFSEVVA